MKDLFLDQTRLVVALSRSLYSHYLDTKRVFWNTVETCKSLLVNQSEGSPNGMAVDLKSTVRKDLRVRILRPPCFRG